MTAQDFANEKFNYLVLGGGTAGLVVAARISEDPDIKVGVLEAGGHLPHDTPAVTVPGRFGEGIGTDIDWGYETTPQPELRDRKLLWPRGKVLGGTSALNFMLWNRPAREDLDAWRDLGNSGWGWDDLQPFYHKAENFTPPDSAFAKQHHISVDSNSLGKTGPVQLSYMKEFSASHQYWHDTLANLDLPTNHSHLSGSNVGPWTSVAAVDPKEMTRSWAATAYYAPNAKRENLFVLTEATVRNIVIEHEGGGLRAKGARFDHAGQQYTATASEEVILCAGSIASPQILELSGIGSPAVLEKASIEVKVANKNVGENLQDHPMSATIYEVDPSIPCADDLRNNKALGDAADELYQLHKSGPRTILGWDVCYTPLEHFVSPDELASLAEKVDQGTPRGRIMAERLSKPQRLGQVEYIFDVGQWSAFFPAQAGKKYATFMPVLQYPFSRGSVHIASSEPHDKPIINPRFFEGEGKIDLDILDLGAHFGQKILETKPLSGFVQKRVWPPADVDKTTDWKPWLVDNTVVDWHPIGTCAMGGSEGNSFGVVDEQLRVYGVEGLRVADASIMPLQISAHLQATVYAIGEKASAMIVEDRERSRYGKETTNGTTNGVAH